jgi:hypothetical protein
LRLNQFHPQIPLKVDKASIIAVRFARKRYDSSQAGAYFVTIAAFQGECLFGGIVKGKMKLNNLYSFEI